MKKLPTPKTSQSSKQDEEVIDQNVGGHDGISQSSKGQEDSQSVCSSQTLTEELGKSGTESEVRVQCDGSTSDTKSGCSDTRTSKTLPSGACNNKGEIIHEVQSKNCGSLPQSTGQNDVNTNLGAVINDNLNRTSDVFVNNGDKVDNSSSSESTQPAGTELSTGSSASSEPQHSDIDVQQDLLSREQRKLQREISQDNLADKLKRSKNFYIIIMNVCLIVVI